MDALTVWTPHLPGGAAFDALLGWTLAFVALAGLCTVLGAAACLGRDPVARRMRGIAPRRPAGAGGGVTSARLRTRTAPGRRPVLLRFDVLLKPRVLSGAVGCGVFLGLWLLADRPPAAALVGTMACVYVGMVLPRRWLARRRAARREAVMRARPDALDLTVICVEAGLGLDAALVRVGEEIASVHPALAEEFATVSLALRAGKSRAEALSDFARRCAAPEASAVATLLVQAGRLGTGVAEGLRRLAEEMRDTQLLEVEETAHKMPVKLTIPLVVCILPALITVVLLPGIVTIVRDVLPNLGR